MTRLQADLLLLFAAAIWGLAFVFQKSAMDHVGPLTFIAARGLVAALALAPLAIREQRRSSVRAGGGLLRIAGWGGALFFVAGWLQQYGLVTASVTNTGFLTSLYVIFTPFIVWIAFRKPPARIVAVAVAMAAAGTWALGGGNVDGFGAGDLLVAVSAIFWAIHLVVTGASSKHEAPITFTCLQFAVVAAIALAAALVFENLDTRALLAAWSSILYVGVLSSALTFTLLAVAMKHTPASEAAILVSMETVFAALAGALLLGERLSLLGWTGAGLMLAATLLVQLAPTLDKKMRAGPV
ncbi:MAG: DMT family transporter [Hyphomicrobiaceae bacterium]